MTVQTVKVHLFEVSYSKKVLVPRFAQGTRTSRGATLIDGISPPTFQSLTRLSDAKNPHFGCPAVYLSG